MPRAPTPQDVFRCIDQALIEAAPRLAFHQLRVAAEHLAVHVGAFALDRWVEREWPGQYRVHLERRNPAFGVKLVDLQIVPISGGVERWKDAFVQEWKMAWQHGLRENAAAIQSDLERKLGKVTNGRAHACVVYFGFRDGSKSFPYHRTSDFEAGYRTLVGRLGEPVFQGTRHDLVAGDAHGEAQFLAWSPAPPPSCP